MPSPVFNIYIAFYSFFSYLEHFALTHPEKLPFPPLNQPKKSPFAPSLVKNS